jgi:hypothetical protein
MAIARIVLVFILLLLATSSLAFSARAGCSCCGSEEDWETTAISFLEGKPINDTPSSLSGPQLSRLRNPSNFSLLKESPDQASSQESNTAMTPGLNIDLKSIYATPSPTSLGSPCMITASFTDSNPNSAGNYTADNLSAGAAAADMTVYAIIRSSNGSDAGKVNLQYMSGGQYAGIWNANVAVGVYKATVVASALGRSKTLNDVLQIEVIQAA